MPATLTRALLHKQEIHTDDRMSDTATVTSLHAHLQAFPPTGAAARKPPVGAPDLRAQHPRTLTAAPRLIREGDAAALWPTRRTRAANEAPEIADSACVQLGSQAYTCTCSPVDPIAHACLHKTHTHNVLTRGRRGESLG